MTLHFQLLVPSREPTHEAALSQAGLDGFEEGVATALVEFAGQRCFWCHWTPPGVPQPTLNSHPDLWTAALPWLDHAAGRYWIRLDPHDLPRPHELLRPRPFEGQRIDMGGESWLLPSPPRLPRQMLIGASGRFEPRVDPQFAWALTEAARWRELAAQGNTAHDLRDAATTVYRLLGLNYRLTPEVANALGLFTSATVEAGLIALIGGRDE